MTEFTAAFRALGDPTRQKLLALLEEAGESRVSDLAARFDMSQPSISHHLKILKEAGLAESARRGKEIFYSINEAELTRCCGVFFAKFECCQPLLKGSRVRGSKGSS